jgi:hypothetical protein
MKAGEKSYKNRKSTTTPHNCPQTPKKPAKPKRSRNKNQKSTTKTHKAQISRHKNLN